MLDEVKSEEPGFYKLAMEIRTQLNDLRKQLANVKTTKPRRKVAPAKKAAKKAAKRAVKSAARKK